MLTAIAVALYVFVPPLAALFVIVVLPFGWGSDAGRRDVSVSSIAVVCCAQRGRSDRWPKR
ncbi:MAG TPA: hypothetical protein VKG38_14960 [Solirubrobacteraceae bacterium]|nr:hypothetical protein [Solirubrobacteraceae bacterium]